MGDRSRASPRSTREYFSAPRNEKSDIKRGRRPAHQYSGSSTEGGPKSTTVTIMSRPKAILSKPKEEPSTSSHPENDQKTASQTIPFLIQGNQSKQKAQATRKRKRNNDAVGTASPAINRQDSVSPVATRATMSILNSALRAEKTQNIRGAAPTAAVEQSLGVMKAAVRLLSDAMDFTDVVADYLSNVNTNFTVIGIIGPQGSGKSTLLSMLAGNDHFDMYRHYAFRPASREAVECCRHQSQKISIYVTKSRMILLDCQAISSPSVLLHLLASSSESTGGRPGGLKAVELCRGFSAMSGEVESLHLTAFLLQVCHTVILSLDWFIDVEVIRHVRTAEMLRVTPTHYSPETMKYKPNRKINFVLAHQRARSEDFQPRNVKNRAKILESLFSDSQLNVKGGVSLGGLGCKAYAEIAPDVNYVLLSEMKPRPKAEVPAMILPYMATDYTPLRAVVDYEVVIRPLRSRLLSLPKEPFVLGNQPFTEIQWYEFATRAWRATHGSADIAKYASTLTKGAGESVAV